MDKKLKSFVIQGLRRHSYKWPPRSEALKLARVERNQYKCAKCEKLFTRKEIKLDHIEPIVPLTGFTTWDVYINRMFCPVEGFQVLCSLCHDEKTWGENSQRNNKYGKRKRTKKQKRKVKKK